MAEGNAYSNLLLMMKQQGYNKDIRVAIGKVISPSPLTIDMGKYKIQEEDMFISDTVDRLITGIIGEIEDYNDSYINHNHTKNILLPENKKLASGDKILVLIDESDFYIIDRVV